MNSLPLVFVCYCSGLWNLIVNDSNIYGLNFTAFQFFFVMLHFLVISSACFSTEMVLFYAEGDLVDLN